jgi:molybdopterin synthase catalytic subunit
MSALEARGRRLHPGPLDVASLTAGAPATRHGGGVLFVGWVRDHHEGRAVRGILYHAHPALAERRLAEIESECERRFGVHCRVWHATGELRVGDASVVVQVCAAHRAEAFDGARFAIDRIKSDVPIWKEERFAEGDSAFVEGVPMQSVPGR